MKSHEKLRCFMHRMMDGQHRPCGVGAPNERGAWPAWTGCLLLINGS